jgi:hypothetical protein
MSHGSWQAARIGSILVRKLLLDRRCSVRVSSRGERQVCQAHPHAQRMAGPRCRQHMHDGAGAERGCACMHARTFTPLRTRLIATTSLRQASHLWCAAVPVSSASSKQHELACHGCVYHLEDSRPECFAHSLNIAHVIVRRNPKSNVRSKPIVILEHSTRSSISQRDF